MEDICWIAIIFEILLNHIIHENYCVVYLPWNFRLPDLITIIIIYIASIKTEEKKVNEFLLVKTTVGIV